jgi:hypothetical protein
LTDRWESIYLRLSIREESDVEVAPEDDRVGVRVL